ncbi:hypothetical protein ABZ297_06610 [Nonomuraea sp. NPDC005983]
MFRAVHAEHRRRPAAEQPLLDGERWKAIAEDVLHGLSLDEPVEEHLAGR